MQPTKAREIVYTQIKTDKNETIRYLPHARFG